MKLYHCLLLNHPDVSKYLCESGDVNEVFMFVAQRLKQANYSRDGSLSLSASLLELVLKLDFVKDQKTLISLKAFFLNCIDSAKQELDPKLVMGLIALCSTDKDEQFYLRRCKVMITTTTVSTYRILRKFVLKQVPFQMKLSFINQNLAYEEDNGEEFHS